MALRTTVKVGDITNLSDARYCAGMGVDILGFCFESESEKYIDPTTFTALSEWLSGVKYTAEFPSYQPLGIKSTLGNYDSVQQIQVSAPYQIDALKKLSLPIVIQIEAADFDSLGSVVDEMQLHRDDVEYYILENKHETNQLTLDDALRLAEQFPILLGFGITPQNILPIVEKSAIQGISLKGSHEIKPGYKDFDALADILEVLEVDEAY
ncbi:MAG: phosphoribosylanthranilate isomerase [Cyclobacteriaceae bacterium]